MNVAGEELSQSACLAPEKSQRKKKSGVLNFVIYCVLFFGKK